MPLRRALGPLAYLFAFALTGCAGTLPTWPPAAGSCITAYKARGRSKPWRYSIGGQRATLAEVESAVGASPALREKIRRHDARERVLGILTPILLPTGAATMFGGALAAGEKPQLGLIAIPGLAALVTGVVLEVTRDNGPLVEPVLAFNNDAARRRGVCADRPRRAPPPADPPLSVEPGPPPSPVEGLPALPCPGWTP